MTCLSLSHTWVVKREMKRVIQCSEIALPAEGNYCGGLLSTCTVKHPHSSPLAPTLQRVCSAHTHLHVPPDLFSRPRGQKSPHIPHITRHPQQGPRAPTPEQMHVYFALDAYRRGQRPLNGCTFTPPRPAHGGAPHPHRGRRALAARAAPHPHRGRRAPAACAPPRRTHTRRPRARRVPPNCAAPTLGDERGQRTEARRTHTGAGEGRRAYTGGD